MDVYFAFGYSAKSVAFPFGDVALRWAINIRVLRKQI